MNIQTQNNACQIIAFPHIAKKAIKTTRSRQSKSRQPQSLLTFLLGALYDSINPHDLPDYQATKSLDERWSYDQPR